MIEKLQFNEDNNAIESDTGIIIADSFDEKYCRKLVHRYNLYNDLVMALTDASPCIDRLIESTRTGLRRDAICDINIKVKTILKLV